MKFYGEAVILEIVRINGNLRFKNYWDKKTIKELTNWIEKTYPEYKNGSKDDIESIAILIMTGQYEIELSQEDNSIFVILKGGYGVLVGDILKMEV